MTDPVRRPDAARMLDEIKCLRGFLVQLALTLPVAGETYPGGIDKGRPGLIRSIFDVLNRLEAEVRTWADFEVH